MLTLGALLVRHTQRSKTRGPDRKSRLGRHSSSGEHHKECRQGRQEGSSGEQYNITMAGGQIMHKAL